VKEFVHSGRKLLATRKFQEAVKVCRIGLLEDPASVEGRLVLAQALMSLARYDEVIAETRAALELRNDSAPATVLLGEALFFKGAYIQARETLQRAAELDPDNALVKRLLDELDATVEVGIEETPDEMGDATRSYPDIRGDPAVGDETEIQELPSALQDAAHEPAGPASPDGEASRGAVEAAHKAANDQERPDPVAGEVKIGTGEIAVGASGPAAPDIKVDISRVDEVPQPSADGRGEDADAGPQVDAAATSPEPRAESEPALPGPTSPPPTRPDTEGVGDTTIHTGEIASPSPDNVPTAAARKKPVTPKREEDSHSGARRWAERKWIGPDEAATREAVLVPTPRITTEEMQDSDLFGRGSPTSEQRPGAGRFGPPPKGSPGRSVVVEGGTVETKLSRPEPSVPRAHPAPPGRLRNEQPTAAAKARPSSDPWTADDDEETRPLRTVSEDSDVASHSGGASPSSLAKRQPPPPPAPPLAKSPFRIPPLPELAPRAGSGPPPPGRPGPIGSEPPAPPGPGRLGPDARGRPKSAPPPPGPRGHQPPDPAAFDSPELSGVHFDAPPAAPPTGIAGGPSILPPRPLQPRATPITPVRPLPIPSPGPASQPSRAPLAAPSPAAWPQQAAPHLATTGRVFPEPPREHTAPAARYPSRNWVTAHWRLLAVGGGVLGLLATVILIVLAMQKDRHKQTVNKHLTEARAQVEIASFESLQRADKMLLKVLQESSGHKEAKSLRLFAAAVTAVQFGGSTDRAEQMLDKGGHQDNDLLAAARILVALASGDRERTRSESQKGASRWPQSIYVAYGRGLEALYLGAPDKSLRLLDALTAQHAKTLILHAKILALLALGQHKDVGRLLESIPEKKRQTPWVRLLGIRHALARTRTALPPRGLDPALSLVADNTGRVSPRHKRWAHYLLAEGYGRLSKDVERQRHLALVLTGGGFRDPALAEAVAMHQVRWKAPADASQLIQTVRRRYPGRLTAIVIEAHATLQQSRFKEVLAQLDAVAEKRRTPEMNLLRARSALALSQFSLARQILIELRKNYPNLTGVLVAWAKLLTQEGRLDEALSALEKVLNQEPRNVEVIRDAARLELRRGKAADAVIRLQVAVRLRARDPELRAELVRAYLAAGNYKFAETSIEAAIAAFPHEPSILSGKGQLMQILGRFDDALQAFDEALKKKPRLTEALVGRAEALLESGRLAEAAKAVDKAVKPAPEMRRLLRGWLALERWSERLGDRYRARTQLTAAAKQKGAIGRRAAGLLLEYYAKAMSPKEGEKEFRELSRRYGAMPELRSAMALVWLDDDSYNAAKGQLRSALADPTFSQLSPVARARVYARLAHAFWLAGNFSVARNRAHKALKIWPRCPRALAILGIAAYEVAQFSQAKDYLKKAVEANPNFALAHHYLGKSYKQLGQRRDARHHLRRYLQLRPKGPLAKDSKRAL